VVTRSALQPLLGFLAVAVALMNLDAVQVDEDREYAQDEDQEDRF
jgi:hypothetical protein